MKCVFPLLSLLSTTYFFLLPRVLAYCRPLPVFDLVSAYTRPFPSLLPSLLAYRIETFYSTEERNVFLVSSFFGAFFDFYPLHLGINTATGFRRGRKGGEV